MAEENMKNPVEVILIYDDGEQKKLRHFALSGQSEDGSWYTVMESPVHREGKIKMNNNLVDLSNKLIESIGM